jgi:ABC-type transport system involved in multi-copper enzyme maturation permease subunit
MRHSSLPRAAGRAGLAGTIQSEFTKLRSVRSTYWTLAVLLVISIGFGALIAAVSAPDLNAHPANKAGFDATQGPLIPFFFFGQLVIIVLGSLAITSEYSTGMIRTSLTAMPRRGVVYAAKAVAFTAVALVTTLVTAFITFFLSQALLSGTGVSASLSQPNVLRAIVGSALFVTLVALIAFGVGAIIRHTAGTITTVIGVTFVLPIVAQILQNNFHWDILRFMPDAGLSTVASITATIGPADTDLWSAWPQLGVTALYTAVILAVGAMLFGKRDA